jgi:predicted nucleotidyltransferase
MENLSNLINILGKHLNDEIPIRQLSIESNVPNTTAHRIIEQNKDVFKINKKGNLKLVSLNTTDSITKNHLILSERTNSKRFIENNPKFKIIKRDLPKGNYTLILFGSRASETNRKKSDIDFCIINKEGKKNINFSNFEMLYDLEINPIFFKKTEFIAMLKDKEHNLANEIIKKHIILYGEEYFWNIIWQHGIQ